MGECGRQCETSADEHTVTSGSGLAPGDEPTTDVETTLYPLTSDAAANLVADGTEEFHGVLKEERDEDSALHTLSQA